jgi:Rho-binding antiterminator
LPDELLDDASNFAASVAPCKLTRDSGANFAHCACETRNGGKMPDYEPIDCSDHDKLEALATRRQIARISYRSQDGSTDQVEDLIEDIYARDGVEYMRTAGGRELRLDALMSVEGKRRAE